MSRFCGRCGTETRDYRELNNVLVCPPCKDEGTVLTGLAIMRMFRWMVGR